LPTAQRHLVEMVSPALRDLWRSAVSADTDALLSQILEWTDLISAVEGWTDASRLYRWPSGRHLVLPMAAKRTCGITLFEESLPAGWGYGGLVGGSVTPNEAAAVYADLATSYPLRRSICPNCPQGTAWNKAIDGVPNATIARSRAHAVNLEGGADAVWKRLYTARRRIRKTEKQGLEVECDTTGKLRGVLQELWLLSTERWARNSRLPLWLARARLKRFHSEKRWKQIAERATGAVVIWVARYHGALAAGILALKGPNDHSTRAIMDKNLRWKVKL
jgi:hypothetical protein